MVVARSLAQRRQIPFRLTALPICVSRTFLFLGQVEAKRKGQFGLLITKETNLFQGSLGFLLPTPRVLHLLPRRIFFIFGLTLLCASINRSIHGGMSRRCWL